MRHIVGLLVLMTVTAAACSDDNPTADDADPPASVSVGTTDPAPTAPPETTTAPAATTVEVATINVLHGLIPPISGCQEYTDQCLAPVRTDILWN